MAFGFSAAARERPAADVSVVVPVYNHERYVAAALESALVQTVRPREIVCIDDGSTDGSARRVEEVARESPLVRFWSRPNQGAHATINEGIAAARGRYVAILNSDDLFHPERLARCVARLDADPGLSLVTTGISFVDGDGAPIENRWWAEACAFHREVGDAGLALVNANFVMTTSNMVMRRALLDEMGGFEALRYAHDLDFCLRLVAAGKRLAVVPRALLSYRFHGANTIAEAHRNVRVEWAAAVAFFLKRLAASGGERSDPRYLARVAEIADRHALTRLVALVLARAQGGAAASGPGACLADPAFLAVLRESAA